MLSGERHTETEVGADMICRPLPESAKHLDDRQAVTLEIVDDCGAGALCWREKQTVDAVLAHAGDEALLSGR